MLAKKYYNEVLTKCPEGVRNKRSDLLGVDKDPSAEQNHDDNANSMENLVAEQPSDLQFICQLSIIY